MADAWTELSRDTGDAWERMCGESGDAWNRLPGDSGDAWTRLLVVCVFVDATPPEGGGDDSIWRQRTAHDDNDMVEIIIILTKAGLL